MAGATAPASTPAPGIARRFACMIYEGMLLFAIGFAGTFAFTLAFGIRETTGAARILLQATLAILFALYFLGCWLRGGQTLAMQAWRIRLIAPGYDRVPLRRALLRLIGATVFMAPLLLAGASAVLHADPWIAVLSLAASGIGLGWARFDRDRQFLHDRLAGTRLILLDKKA